MLLLKRIFKGQEPVHNFQKHDIDFVTNDHLRLLVDRINKLAAKSQGPHIEYEQVLKEISHRDSQVNDPYSKDAQVMLVKKAQSYWPDGYTRVAKNYPLLEDSTPEDPRANPKFGPLIAVRLNIITRKTLGGIKTNANGQVISKTSNLSISWIVFGRRS